MGKISRFGLMELSRQRLRPALSEGSHVTCPRCNGTGHIRDTESSALQVLRIIQEEAMKENTAAIHCQVPVEVTAFLLNEKRQEINKIESRFKVGVVLIPNKHLDTPHYKLERLRHDDARLDDPRASWKMAEEAARELEAETGYSKRAEETKPRQEAAVKGITPERPAPSPAPQRQSAPEAAAPVAAAPASGGGFMKWLKGLFGAQPAAVPAPAPAAQETAARPARERAERGERGEKAERGERGGDRNRNRRGGAAQQGVDATRRRQAAAALRRRAPSAKARKPASRAKAAKHAAAGTTGKAARRAKPARRASPVNNASRARHASSAKRASAPKRSTPRKPRAASAVNAASAVSRPRMSRRSKR